MSLTKKILSNTAIHAIGKFGASAIGLVIIGLVTRYLGTEGYGYYTTIFAYLFLFSTIGDLGLYLVTINELGRAGVDSKQLFSNVFTMRLVSGIVLMALAAGLIWLFPYPLLVKLGALVVSISVILMMVDQITVALFQQKMKTAYAALSEIGGKILILGLTILVIKNGWGFMTVLWTVVAGFLFHFLINICFARSLLKFKLAFDKEIWKRIIKKSWPVATYMIFSMIYFKADTIILSLYHPATVVGLYGAPYKILEVLIAFPAIFMGLVSPHLSRAWSEKDLSAFKKYFQKAFDGLSLIVWPMVLGTIALASPIMNLIAGPEFKDSAHALQILIVATGIIFLAHLSTFAVVALEKQKQMMKFYMAAAGLALLLYFIFIPKYSLTAAAIITVLVEFLILLSSWLMVRQEAKIKLNFNNSLKALIVAMVMFIFLSETHLSLLVSIIIGGIIYIGGIFIAGLLNKKLISNLIPKGGK